MLEFFVLLLEVVHIRPTHQELVHPSLLLEGLVSFREFVSMLPNILLNSV